MDQAESWQSVESRLRGAKSITVDLAEIGGPASDDDCEVIELMNAARPPPPIMQFYAEANGVKLLWSGRIDGKAVQGSVNIVTLIQSAVRAPAEPGDEPLEGVLWNEEFPEAVR